MIELNAYVWMNLMAALVLLIASVIVLKKEGLSAGRILFIAGISILLYFVGARLLYGILYPQKILNNPGKLFELRLVNFSMYGGLTLSLASFYLLAKRYQLPFVKLTDQIVPVLGIAIAFSKMGCFFNGCCYGVQTHLPWGIIFERAEQSPVTRAFGNSPFIRMISGTVDVPRHPTQLYEVIFSLFAAFVAYKLVKMNVERNKNGVPTLAFILVLTMGRWVSFAFRDFPYATEASNFVRGPLTYGVILGVAIFWLIRRTTPSTHNEAKKEANNVK